MPSRRAVITIIGVALILIFVMFASSLWEIVNADELVVIQTLSGELKVVTEPGPTWQGFGKVTAFPLLDIYEFEAPVIFNDAGSATLKGSIQWEMPRDVINVLKLKTRYGSADAIRKGLVNTIVDKCVFMTGPLMSSAESYATKKTDLIRYIEDQITRGVYQTFTKEAEVEDPVTGTKKSTKITEIQMGKNGLPMRQEEPVLNGVGIITSNLAIKAINYSDKVNEQIAEQQKITMAVQTAIADARKAEQNYITITKNGEASAATAKWEQEVLKAKAVTAAQQELEVGKLRVATAEQYKKQRILEAEADAEYKRKIIVADGALTQKLATYEKIMLSAMDNMGKQRWVPEIIMGGTGGGKDLSATQQLIEMLSAKTARDLKLDLTVPAK